MSYYSEVPCAVCQYIAAETDELTVLGTDTCKNFISTGDGLSAYIYLQAQLDTQKTSRVSYLDPILYTHVANLTASILILRYIPIGEYSVAVVQCLCAGRWFRWQ
jgi:hypothetical protein